MRCETFSQFRGLLNLSFRLVFRDAAFGVNELADGFTVSGVRDHSDGQNDHVRLQLALFAQQLVVEFHDGAAV